MERICRVNMTGEFIRGPTAIGLTPLAGVRDSFGGGRGPQVYRWIGGASLGDWIDLTLRVDH